MQEREEERIATAIAAHARVPAFTAEIVVLDLSTRGCRIQACSGFAQIGSTILFRLSDRNEVAGQIIWKNSHQFGVRFFNDLPQKAIDWIATGYA